MMMRDSIPLKRRFWITRFLPLWLERRFYVNYAAWRIKKIVKKSPELELKKVEKQGKKIEITIKIDREKARTNRENAKTVK